MSTVVTQLVGAIAYTARAIGAIVFAATAAVPRAVGVKFLSAFIAYHNFRMRNLRVFIPFILFIRLFYKALAFHLFGLSFAHYVQKRGRNVAKRTALFEFGVYVLFACHDKRHGICGVSRARRAVVETH